jgi:hypothetical protein
MNPETNKFEKLSEVPKELREAMFKQTNDLQDKIKKLYRPNGEPVPKHWSIFNVGEEVIVKDYTFKIAYMNETTLILEPVAPVVLDIDK